MANPNYKGQGQPAAASSGWLSGWFGTQPAYKSAPAQPVAASTTTTATSATASAAVPIASSMGCDEDGLRPIAIVIPRDVIDR